METEEGQPSAEEYPTDETQPGLISNALTDKPDSPARQRLALSAVLLSTAEELHCLPYSWSRPCPPERVALEAWINDGVSKSNAVLATLAAVVWVSIHAGRSLARTLEIGVGGALDWEWRYFPASSVLRRLPPKRHNGWEPKTGSESTAWVLPIAASNELHIPPAINAVLMARVDKTPQALCLADLWSPNWSDRPELVFRQSMTGPLARVTPGMLGNALPQEMEERFGDATFARLISSHPRSGLPGACAYAGWNNEAIAKAFAPPVAGDNELPQDGVTAIGSRLAPIDELLVGCIRHARQKVTALRIAGDPIAFSNAWMAYHATSLLAATGGRPIRDPFESIEHFDLTEQFVYLDDKASSDIRQGRLVPLARQVVAFLQTEYPTHLIHLAGAVEAAHPKLAKEILALAAGTPSGLPPFFFLGGNSSLGWDSVSETTISNLGLFTWPLPANLFRHRLARALRRKGVDSEVIDGFLGHAEAGSASFGDYSPRAWKEDANRARPAMEAIFEELDFTPIHTWDSPPDPLPKFSGSEPPLDRTRLFGRKARERERRKKIVAAMRDARQSITNYLKNKGIETLADLEPEQIDEISVQLLFRRNGLPHPRGGLMYRHFMNRLSCAKRAAGKQLRLRRQFMRLENESSPFNPLVVGATESLTLLRKELAAIFNQISPSRLSLGESAVLAATEFCLTYRIANLTLLKDVMRGKNFRIVKLSGQLSFEWGAGIAINNRQGARFRRPISYRLASLLDPLLTKSYVLQIADAPLVSALSPLGRVLEARGVKAPGNISNIQLLTVLAQIVDQANALTLPGIVAGYLAGRVDSTPLGWYDWVRLTTGKRIVIASESSESETAPITTSRISPLPPDADEVVLQRNAVAFFKRLRQLLEEDRPGHSSETAAQNRGTLANRIDAEIKRHTVSQAVVLLGQWLVQLMKAYRSKSHQTHKKLSTHALKRYLGALSPPFEECGHDVNLIGLDGDGVTAFYSFVLEATSASHVDYVKKRLLDFHRFARSSGVEDPDWSELNVDTADYPVSPGFIAEAEYQAALATILASEAEERRRFAAAFLLLLAYRFGLRSGEAHGLLRQDWLAFGDWIVVLVRPNRFRGLKAPQSRRLVPLVFPLSAPEQMVIDRILADAEAQGGGDKFVPLLGDISAESELLPIESIKMLAVTALRSVSANPSLTLHHARHTAGNRCALAVFDLSLPGWPHELDPKRIPGILLATNAQSRRRTWAVGRFMGHAAPRTTFRSYLHFLADWAVALVPAPDYQGRKHPIRNVINLDDFENGVTPAPNQTVVIQNRMPRPSDLLRFLRLVSRGKSAEAAAASLGLLPEPCQASLEAIRTVSARTKLPLLKMDKGEDNPKSDIKFLRRISESAWNRLIPYLMTRDELWDKGQSPSPGSMLRMETLANMIGPRCHIVLCDETDFRLFSLIASYLGVGQNEYKAIRSQESTRLKALADSIGMSMYSPKEVRGKISSEVGQIEEMGKGKSSLYPDPAFDVAGEPDYRTRCAVQFKENQTHPIHRTVQFVLLFLVSGAFLCSGNF